MLEDHMESCETCRAALEAQRATLELLGATLEAAPAPDQLSPWRKPVIRPRSLLEKIWFSTQLKAVLSAGAIHSVLFLLAGTLVVFTVVKKSEVSFEAPRAIERPKMKLKKPKVRVNETSRPKSVTRIVSRADKTSMTDIQLPEMSGMGSGLGGVSIDGYDMAPDLGEVSMSGRGSSAGAVPEPAPSDHRIAGHDGFASSTVARPRMQMKKLQVPLATKKGKPQRPKLRKRIVAKSNLYSDDIAVPDIAVPEINGIRGGIESDVDRSGLGDVGLGFSMPQDEVRGQKLAEASKAAPAPVPAESQSGVEGAVKREKGTISFTMPEMAVFGISSKADSLPKAAPVPAKPESLAYGALKESESLAKGKELDEVDSDTSSDLFEGNARQEEEPRSGEPMTMMLDRAVDELKRVDRKPEPAVFNPYMLAKENAFSTFSIDVDTASYGLARQQLLAGGLPDPEMVRTEEFINSFDYDYRPPAGKQTFAVHTEMAPSPFRTNMDLIKIGIKGRRIGRDDHRGAVLTLVIDTSGSMATPERLGLVKQSLALLIDQLNPSDMVAIVQFGGKARLVREHTPASEKAQLLEAINELQPGGATQFDKGLELGYQIAKSGFRAGDSNRIMILSDGVANLGELDPEMMLQQVAEQRKKGIYLSVLGFGAGSYDDDMLERLANSGDGMYAYIDTLEESQRLLVDQLAATLHVIASDVKIQVEFNPARVLRYRQLGYENRQLTKEQFRDDTVDAGEVGSGQSVTALYDVELIPGGPKHEPIATVYVRYRRADNGAVEEISSRVMDTARQMNFEDADERFQLAACTAEFAERLRRSPYADGTEMKDIKGKLQSVAMKLELDEQVKELLRLISIAERLEQ